VIPTANIIAWQEHAPWSDEAQVEQDLVHSRAIVELFSDPRAQKLLALRGGTALHKLYLAPGARYSEDIDLVQVEAGPAKPVLEVVRDRLDPWLGQAKTRRKANGVQLLYHFECELPPVRRMRLKVEVNTREHLSVAGFSAVPFAVDSPWFSGAAEVVTYSLDELLGTKLRALYQRKKGRDLFDLWYAGLHAEVDTEAVVDCFRANLDHKTSDPAFVEDVEPLLRRDVVFDFEEAGALVIGHRVQILGVNYAGSEHRGLIARIRTGRGDHEVSLLDVRFEAGSDAAQIVAAYRKWLGM